MSHFHLIFNTEFSSYFQTLNPIIISGGFKDIQNAQFKRVLELCVEYCEIHSALIEIIDTF